MRLEIDDRFDGFFAYNFVLYDNGYYIPEYKDNVAVQFILFLRYIASLEKLYGFQTQRTEELIQFVIKCNMQNNEDDMYFVEKEEIMDQYNAVLYELSTEIFSLLDKNDISSYSIDISAFSVDADEGISPMPESMEEVLDRLDLFPSKAKEVLLKVMEETDVMEKKLEEAAEEIDEKYISFDIVIDYNYSKYRDMYKKRFGNDHSYQIFDKSYPCLVSDLCICSKILDSGVRCDVFLSGYEVEAYDVKTSLFNPLYFFNLLDFRKKIGVL